MYKKKYINIKRWLDCWRS